MNCVTTPLACAQAGNYEFVSGRSTIERRSGEWIDKGRLLFRDGGFCSAPVGPVMHSTVLYRSYLRLFKAEVKCLDCDLNGDAFGMRRLFNAGVRAGFVDQVVTLQPLRPDQTRRQAAHPVE